MDGHRPHRPTSSPKPVGTGAYTLDNFKPQAFTLAANPSYWGGEPAVKTVRYLSLSGNTAGADALAAGTIDWQTGPVPDIQNVSKNYPGYDAITIPQNQVGADDLLERRARLRGPADRPGRPPGDLLRPEPRPAELPRVPGHRQRGVADVRADQHAGGPHLDRRRRARRPVSPRPGEGRVARWRSAGYAKGADGIYAKDGQKLTLTVEVVTGWTDYITAIDTMAQQLKAAGIELTASQSSWNEWTRQEEQGQLPARDRLARPGRRVRPVLPLRPVLQHRLHRRRSARRPPTNIARFSDPAVDAALETLKATHPEDTEARQAQFDVIQQTIVEDMPYVPVLTGGTTSEYHSRSSPAGPRWTTSTRSRAIWASPDNSIIFKSLKPVGE